MLSGTPTAKETTQPKRRKPGGQPGNTNALKHGFYTKYFSLTERRGLQAAEGVILRDEIDLLRVLIRRFSEQIQASQAVSLYESAQFLAVISEAMSRLASLLRTDHMLGGPETNALSASLDCVLKELSEELGLNER